VWLDNVGYDAVLSWLGQNIILYEGIPRTQHVVTNVLIELAEGADIAHASSYLTVLQQIEPTRLEVITAVAYQDSFARALDGWHFTQRSVRRRFVGDNTHHRPQSVSSSASPVGSSGAP
jgi:hypothetical protein